MNEIFLPVIENIKIKKYVNALEQLDLLYDQKKDKNTILKLRGLIFSKIGDWENVIINYENYLIHNPKSFEMYNNLGVAYFNLGKLKESTDSFLNSEKINSNSLLALENLGLTYRLRGDFQLSVKYFLKALNLEKNNNNIKQSLVDTFNYYQPKNINNPIVKSNLKIMSLGDKIKQKKIDDLNIKGLLEDSEKILIDINEKIITNETQIFRRNGLNLDCKRHFKIYNKFQIIPNYCFQCFKVQINVVDVLNLIKLYFLFNTLDLANNNIKKSVVELRNFVKGNYKGYIFTSSIEESQKIMDQLKTEISNKDIKIKSIGIKHGCTEYYEKYPEFQEISEDNKDKIYKKNWSLIEEKFDKINLTAEKNKEIVSSKTINSYNLSDFLIIKNWLIYAKLIDDKSAQQIFGFDPKNENLQNFLSKQIDFRKKDYLK